MSFFPCESLRPSDWGDGGYFGGLEKWEDVGEAMFGTSESFRGGSELLPEVEAVVMGDGRKSALFM